MATIKSIEEKAKAYDQALEKLRSLHDDYDTVSTLIDVKEELENIFPELKESEDERIRKDMIETIKKEAHDFPSSVIAEKSNSWLSWLEKQGEQKPVVIPKFRIGDIIKATEDGEVFTIRTITKDKYIYTDDSFDWIKDQDEYELVEQKPTDEEMKELLHTEYEKGRADAIEEMQNHTWSEDDKDILFRTINDLKFLRETISIDPKYAVNIIDKEREINWLKSLKDRIQPQPKQEWSEKDERLRNSCISHIEEELERIRNDKYGHSEIISDLKESCRERINWLKTLRPQKNEALPQWRRLPLNSISYAPDSWRVMDVITSTNGANSASVSALVKGDYYVPLFELEKFIKNV